MSQLSSSTSPTRSKPGGPYRKPRADVFTMLLLISLVALILGIICLYAEMKAYQWEFKGGPTITGMAIPAEMGVVQSPVYELTEAAWSREAPWASARG